MFSPGQRAELADDGHELEQAPPPTRPLLALVEFHHGLVRELEGLDQLTGRLQRAHPRREMNEWRQRLDRKGNPTTELIALPVKDPFHLPRAVILILQLLGSSTSSR